MDIIEIEGQLVKQKNRIEELEQEKRETQLDIEMNRKVNAMSLEERMKTKYEVEELKETVKKIDNRLRKVEEKK